MAMEIPEDTNALIELIAGAVDRLRALPDGYAPSMVARPTTVKVDVADAAMLEGVSIEDIFADDTTRQFLQDQTDTIPVELLNTFVNASRLISHILAGFGVQKGQMWSPLDPANFFETESFDLMQAFVKIHEEIENSEAKKDFFGARRVLELELNRRALDRIIPYSATLTTLIGNDALMWFTAQSQDPVGRILPHEFSRTGWPRLFEIKGQLDIEKELLKEIEAPPHISKLIVVAAWTMAVLSEFFPPNLFIGEETSHLLSKRGGKMTVVSGRDTHTILGFDRSRAAETLSVLSSALQTDEISAADAMWIGLGMAKVDNQKVRHVERRQIDARAFSVFLSHRGKDSKLELANAVTSRETNSNIFLDCLVLPKGMINRNFVFGSICCSEKIYVIESEHYTASAWCRKEAWLADEMAQHGLLTVERLKLSNAVQKLTGAAETAILPPREHENTYLISPRIHSDLTYWARAPNLESLKKLEGFESAYSIFQAVMGNTYSDVPNLVDHFAHEVQNAVNAAQMSDPNGEVVDVWATAAQLIMMIFATKSYSKSKDEVRKAVDRLNQLIASFFASNLTKQPEFIDNPTKYISLMVASVVLDATNYKPHTTGLATIKKCLGDSALLRDGMILLDTRIAGTLRDFNLQIMALIIKANVGSVGLIQCASDEIHRTYLDDTPLEVFPCITIHEGMEPWFLTQDA